MNNIKKFLTASLALCFLLLPEKTFAGETAGAAATLQPKAVTGAPSPMAKPAKFPAGGKPSAPAPAPKPEPTPTAEPPAAKPEPAPKIEPPPTKPTPKPAINQPTSPKPAAKPQTASAKPAVKPAAKSTETTAKKTAKPKKKAKAPKASKKKDEKQSKKTDKKSGGNISIACKETAPFFPAKKVDALVKTARKYLGVKYVYGGADPKGFDCSGYIMYIFKRNGASLPRAADDQYDVGKRVTEMKSLVKGDLVFFSEDRREISHVGLYLGGGNFIHASSSKGIRVDSLSNEYWKPRYVGAKHLIK